MTRHHQSWIWNRTSAMVAVLASALVFATAWRAVDAVDKVTGLPLHPGLDVQQSEPAQGRALRPQSLE
jgi:hypothetical protein